MLTQAEADALIAMRKAFIRPGTISMPPGADQTYELIGDDRRERFLFDLSRGTFRLSKLKFQTRGKKVFVLVRLDIDGAPHTNPDGAKIDGSHIHIYREAYEDKWAYPIDPQKFRNLSDIQQTFLDFCQYCSIQDAPPFQEGLL